MEQHFNCVNLQTDERISLHFVFLIMYIENENELRSLLIFLFHDILTLYLSNPQNYHWH